MLIQLCPSPEPSSELSWGLGRQGGLAVEVKGHTQVSFVTRGKKGSYIYLGVSKPEACLP